MKDCPYDGCIVAVEDHDCFAKDIAGHKCFGDLTHQHVPKRSQGGKVAVATLCAGVHDAIDNGIEYQGRRLANDIKESQLGGFYRIYDRDSAKEEDAHLVWRSLNGHSEPEGGHTPAPPPAKPASFDEWEAEGKALGSRRKNTPWDEGDWLLKGERLFGEELAAQGWDALQLNYSALSQRIRVAREFPPRTRVKGASWSAHRVVLPLNADERRHWLRKMLDEGWTEKELRDELIAAGLLEAKPRKVKVITCKACGTTGGVDDFSIESVDPA